MTHHGDGASRTLRLTAVLVVLGIAGLLMSGETASAASSAPSQNTNKVVLKIGTTDDPDTLSPYTALDTLSWEIFCLNYDGLFGVGSDMQTTLGLASEFPTQQNGGISADGKIWTIHLKPNLKWSDGQPLTAADVAWNFNYNIEKRTKFYYGTMSHVKRVEVVNPTTVRIICAEPEADLETAYIPILPKHIWSKIPTQEIVSTYRNSPPIVGSGPFQVVQWKKSDYVHLVRNPYYWGKKPSVTDIYFETYQNANTLASDLRAGTIAAAENIPSAEFSQLTSTPGIDTVAYNLLSWDYLSLNCYMGKSSTGNPVLRDPRFRQALNYATDHQALCNLAYGSRATPGTTILPPNTWTNPDYHWQPPASQMYTFDLAKASQLLTAAGYPLKDGVRVNKQGKPITLRLAAPSDSAQEESAAKMIAGWFEKLGLKITLTMMDEGALSSHVYNYNGNTYAPDFDMYVWFWGGFSDPGQTMECMTTAQIGEANEPGWSDPAYDKLSAEQSVTLDPQKRAQLLWQMQQIMYEQTPWIVLVYPQALQAYNTSKWTGWTRVLNGSGPAFYTGNQGQIDSYLDLRPAAYAATTSSSSNTTLILVVVVVVVIVAGSVAFVVVRRRRRVEDEA